MDNAQTHVFNDQSASPAMVGDQLYMLLLLRVLATSVPKQADSYAEHFNRFFPFQFSFLEMLLHNNLPGRFPLTKGSLSHLRRRA